MVATLLVLLLSCAACTNGATTPNEATPTGPRPAAASREDTIQIRVGTSEAAPESSATITFVGVVTDSRCPRQVTCFWAGDAVVQLRVQPKEGEPRTVELHANERLDREATIGTLTVTLQRLDPYPEADAPIASDSYVVTLSVRVQ